MLADEEDNGVLGLLGLFEELQEFADLLIETTDLGEVSGETGAGFGVVVHVGWRGDLGRIVEVLGTAGPGRVRIIGGEDEEPGLGGIARHEGLRRRKVVGSIDVLVGEGFLWPNVLLVLQSSTIAHAVQMGEKALGAFIDAGMVRVSAAANGVETGIERVPQGRAGGGGGKHAVEVHALGFETIHVGRLHVRMTQRPDVAPAHVIGNDDEEVGLGGQQRRGQQQGETEEKEEGFHGDTCRWRSGRRETQDLRGMIFGKRWWVKNGVNQRGFIFHP